MMNYDQSAAVTMLSYWRSCHVFIVRFVHIVVLTGLGN